MTRALVTGANGFIGSHLAELLRDAGYDVRALAEYNSFDSQGWLDDLSSKDGIEVVLGDVRDPGFCRSLTAGVDVVFHLAALIAIPYSYLAPESYVATNVGGTLNMCAAALESGVSRFVHTSTSEVYGTARYVPIDEEHPLQPQSPYSASKIGADAVAMSFHHAFGLPVSIARPFNTFGPRQSTRAVIPTIITQLASGARSIRLGDLRPTRDFNYVEDTCKGLLAIATSDKAVGQTLNIGSGVEISIGDLFEAIRDTMGSSAGVEPDDGRLRPTSSEVFRLLCDGGKLAALTGHAPSVSLRDGLERTVAWFTRRENLEKYRQGTYTI